ncbi:MAG: hypothetical protein OXP69_21605 [Spirochaetaceae bacterium]|nr:hypothetical protein [Spirochaetaceae bacterium]
MWVLLVVFANLGLSMGVILTKDERLAEVEQRLELAMLGPDEWRDELTAVRSELAAVRGELGTEVANLRGVLTELHREVGVGNADLRRGLDALGERVDRIEGIAALPRESRADAARGGRGATTVPRPGPVRAEVPEFDGGADEQSPIW